MAFRVVILGGSGQVGSAVVRALAAEPSCTEVVMIVRRTSSEPVDTRVRHVVLDTAAPHFPDDVATLVRGMAAHGHPVHGVSCVGVGSGSAQWSEDALVALEVGVVGGFARGCRAGGVERFALLSAVGSSAASRFKYPRVMGLKEDAVRAAGFTRLVLFRPGIIAGNAHTPGALAWLGRLVPGGFGTIDQDDVARAFVAELKAVAVAPGEAAHENGAMRRLSRALATLALIVVTLATAAACGPSGPSMAERAKAAEAERAAADARTREESRARRETQRIAALWRYSQIADRGAQTTAAITATDDVDTDGSGPHRVQLVFRDHEKWKRSAYLVLQAGDFACRPECKVQVQGDEAPPVALSAWRPNTDEAIALFIRDYAAVWRTTSDAARLRITFPVKAGGTRTASFEVVGLDESKLPGW